MEILPRLIDLESQIEIRGIKIPEEFYWVLDFPASLAGMSYPKQNTPWATLIKLGFTSLVSLEPGPYDYAPLRIIFSEKLEDLYHGGPPENPEEEKLKIYHAVELAKSAMMNTEGVLVYCYGGTGRTGTVLGCILREFGYPALEIINYLDRIHKARGRRKWPESDWQSDLVKDWLTESH
jgi:protein-tyrosine phosphatase